VASTDVSAWAKRVLARAGPGVVRVGHHGGRGCGIVVGDGLVLTNAHNVPDGTVTVVFGDGVRREAEVAGVDPDGDLAVLRVGTGALTPLEWSPREAEAGDLVFAVVRLPDGGTRITAGMVSATGRWFPGPRGRPVGGAVEHTAPLARGSSGSALVDPEGRVVGLNTHRLGDGLYLALPGGGMAARVAALAKGEVPRRLRLGVALAPPHVGRRLRAAVGLEPRDGLLVRRVEPGSPAAAAGLRPGDLIVAADGAPVAGLEDLTRALDRAVTTGAVALRVVRGADELDVAVRWPQEGR
jgi:serine protease Do